MSLVARRVTRLAKERSLRVATRALTRELSVRRAERELARAAAAGEPLIAGPFLGEVGYELLYWIPFLRRRLRELDVDPARVTVLARGGAAAWYGDFAANAVELIELAGGAEAFRSRLLERRGAARDAKQLTVEAFDRELAAASGVAGHLLHPRLMYARLRFAWERLLPVEALTRLADYAPLPVPPAPDLQLPADYVAVKLYFNEALPESDETRALAASLVERLAAEHDVVVLATAAPLDEHDEWRADGPRVVDASRWLEPETNLAVQTAVVARARALVATYGGFSYLGPFVGTPTLAVSARPPDNTFHRELMHHVNPGVAYREAPADDAAALESALTAIVAGA